MSNPTTPFSWQMPTNTDLVTDLPADFEVFGQAVATSMADLLGGTTGQVLAKNTNTDMDFVWTDMNPGDITGVTAGTGISGGGTSGTVTVTNSMATAIDAKGDLIVGTAADAFSRLAVGATNNHVLTVDSAETTGMKWAAPIATSMTLLSTTTLSGASTTISSISQNYKTLVAFIYGMTNATADGIFRILPNNSAGANFGVHMQNNNNTPTGPSTIGGNTYINTVTGLSRTNAFNNLTLQINNYTNATNYKNYSFQGYMRSSTPGDMVFFQSGSYADTPAVTSLVFSNAGGNFSTGTVLLYGVS